jgi:hypothetical protein
MIRYLKSIKKLFSKAKKTEDTEPETELPENYIAEDECSAIIELRLDKYTGDFNIVVLVEQIDRDTSDTLGLLLYLLNSGGLKAFFTEAYGNWAEGDKEKEEFLSSLYMSWLQNEESFSDDYEKLAVKPSRVFGLNSQEL